MKNLSIIIILLLGLHVVAQESKVDDINNISLSVILPDNTEGLSQRAISKIESKIQHIVTKYGVSGQGFTNDFIIYPKFEIYDESVIEGMKNIYKIDAEFNLFIKQLRTGKVFSTYSKEIKGAGLTKEKAIINAISKISTNDKNLKAFIEEGKRKILAYYDHNCNQFVADADTAIKMQKYDKAIAILSSIPREAKSCYSRIQDKSVQAYKAYQKQNCKKNILRAKAEVANNDYSGALYTLKYIDPSSPCGAEAERLIRQVAAKVDAKEQKEWNLMLKKYNDSQNMEKYRLQITKEIAKAYYQSKPQTVIYKSLF